MKVVDYDSVQIEHKIGLDLRIKNIEQILIGKKQDTLYYCDVYKNIVCT